MGRRLWVVGGLEGNTTNTTIRLYGHFFPTVAKCQFGHEHPSFSLINLVIVVATTLKLDHEEFH